MRTGSFDLYKGKKKKRNPSLAREGSDQVGRTMLYHETKGNISPKLPDFAL
jgi:hypothetical protein